MAITSTRAIQSRHLKFISHETGSEVTPSNVARLARSGAELAFAGRCSNITWSDKLNKFVMYAVDCSIDSFIYYVPVFSGHDYSNTEYSVPGKSGTVKLYKFYSSDGNYWTSDPQNPQSVYIDEKYQDYFDGSEAVIREYPFYTSGKSLALPYREGGAFNTTVSPTGPNPGG